MDLLDQFGISKHSEKLPSSLSGGEQQRAAIARALANNPQLVVADEPTGNLDKENSEIVFDLFTQLTRMNKTVVIVTHEKDLKVNYDQMISILDGKIINIQGKQD